MWLLLLWPLTLACAEAEPAPDSDLPSSIALGGGLTAYVPLADGDVVPLVHGLQGGWHVDVALRAFGVEVEGARLGFQALDEATGEVLSFPTEATLDARRVTPIEGGWERLGDRVIFDVASAEALRDRALRLEVWLEGGGERMEDARRVVVGDG